MRGNVYISVPISDIGNALPAVITKYDWTVNTYDEEGNIDTTETVHPTWEQYGEKYKGHYGAPVVVNDVTVYELELSWQASEISALIALGSGKTAPSYTLMNASEARQFILENQTNEI